MPSWKDPIIVATDLNAPRIKLKAISLKQPWADLVASGAKTIETRKWSTPYHGGRILIVSSKKPDMEALPPGSDPNYFGPYGHAVGIALLVGCHPMKKEDELAACCPLYEGAIAWVFVDQHRIKPFPVSGRLGLYDVEIQKDLLAVEIIPGSGNYVSMGSPGHQVCLQR